VNLPENIEFGVSWPKKEKKTLRIVFFAANKVYNDDSAYCLWEFVPEMRLSFKDLQQESGNLRHVCHTWHAKQFPMARRSSKFSISLLLWFTQKIYWSWLV